MPGPPPKPTDLKLLEGTFRKDRTAGNEPQPPREAPPMPDFIRANAVARAEWERIVPMLVTVGTIRESDMAIAALYCDTWARLVAVSSAIVGAGRVSARRDAATAKAMVFAAKEFAANPAETAKAKDAADLARAMKPVAGEFETYSTGAVQVRQLAAYRRQLVDDLVKIGREIGLSASARTRISAAAPEAVDPFEEFLNRKKKA